MSIAISGTGVYRQLHLVGATGTLRTAIWNEKEHIVVPVVAMVEGVVWAVNSETPEFVPATELAETPQQWNGRCAFAGHPKDDGSEVTANTPKILEQSFGVIFSTASAQDILVNKKLTFEVWLDPEKAEKVGPAAVSVCNRLLAGKVVEVSVGCYVVTEAKDGNYGGKEYHGIWHDIVSDHIAFLAEDEQGACSVAAGCGAGRADVRHLITAQGITPILEGPEEKMNEVEKPKKRSLKDKFKDFLSTQLRDNEGVSDVDLRGKLNDALNAVEPGFMGVREVFPKDGVVIYDVAPGDEYMTMRRNFSASDAGVVALGDSAEEVEPIVTYQVKAAEGKSDLDELAKSVAKAIKEELPKAAAEKSCGCGNKEEAPITASTEVIDPVTEEIIEPKKGVADMTKEQKDTVIQALIGNKHSGFTKDDEAMLQAAPDARLDAFLVATEARTEQVKTLAENAKPKQMSEEEWIAVAPPSIQRAAKRQIEQENELKVTLVTAIMKATDEYTDTELAAKDVTELERIARVARINTGNPNYSGRGVAISRAAAEKQEDVYANPPDSYEEALKARRATIQ